MFKLKTNQPDINVVDGPFAGRTYRAGQQYAEIPPEEAAKFEVVATADNKPKNKKAAPEEAAEEELNHE